MISNADGWMLGFDISYDDDHDSDAGYESVVINDKVDGYIPYIHQITPVSLDDKLFISYPHMKK